MKSHTSFRKKVSKLDELMREGYACLITSGGALDYDHIRGLAQFCGELVFRFDGLSEKEQSAVDKIANRFKDNP